MSRLIVLLNIFGLSRAFFESCDQTLNIAAGQTTYVLSPGYAQGYGYNVGSSCRYTISAPVDYNIKASCNINMYDVSLPFDVFLLISDEKSYNKLAFKSDLYQRKIICRC